MAKGLAVGYTDDWAAVVHLAEAVIDPAKAWRKIEKLGHFDDGVPPPRPRSPGPREAVWWSEIFLCDGNAHPEGAPPQKWLSLIIPALNPFIHHGKRWTGGRADWSNFCRPPA